MLKSRLRLIRPGLTVTVKAKSGPVAGRYNESDLYADLTASHEQPGPAETYAESGAVVIATDVFWFEPLTSGGLPAIAEQHVLVDAAGTRYEVVSAEDQGGAGSRLRVVTRRMK